MAKKVCSFTAHKFLPCFLCLTTVMLTGTASRPPKRVEDNKGNFMNYLYLLLLCLTVVVFSCQGDTAFDDASDEDKSIAPKLRPPSVTVTYDEYLRTRPQFQGGVSQRTTRSTKDVVNISIAQNIGGTLEHQIRSITKQQKKAAAQEEEGGGEEEAGEWRVQENTQKPQSRLRNPTRCCCQRPECTEDVSLSQLKCEYSQKPMSAHCVHPSEDRDITYCVTCAPNFA